MPSPLEQALREMLRKAQQENATTAVQPMPMPLPDLDSMMFLSPAARREVEAAQVVPFVRVQQPLERVASTRSSEVSLSALLMESAARAIGAHQDEVASYAIQASDAFSFEFADVEGSTVPNERVRFQVGRESPPHIPMYSAPPRQTEDGEVVGRLQAGRYQPTRITAAEIRALEAVRVRSAPSAHKPVTASVQEPSGGQSRYERLLGPSLLGDD